MSAMRPAAWGSEHAEAADPADAAVPSPCINVCRMDAASGLCEGCLRTLDEIAAWSQMSGREKRAVWAVLEERRQERDRSATPAAQVVPPGTPR